MLRLAALRFVNLLYVATLLLSCLSEYSDASKTSNATRKGQLKAGRCTGDLCRFDPALLGGQRGLPGLKVRGNSEMFEYTGQLIGEMISREIQHARLPDIVHSSQSLLDSRFVLHNGYVARYRCPQKVALGTKAPNLLLLQMQNFDIGINTQLAGHVSMLLPMIADSVVPTGVLKIDLRGVTLAVEFGVYRAARGPKLSVNSCSINIETVEVAMEKGGSSNKTASFLKNVVTKFVRDLMPKQICKMVPRINEEGFNKKFQMLPPSMPLTKLASMTGLEIFKASSVPDPKFCSDHCGLVIATNSTKKIAGGLDAFITALAEAGQYYDKLPGSVSAPKPRRLCSSCPSSANDPSASMLGLSKQLNLHKLTDMAINIKMTNNSADDQGMSADLIGEFSPNAKGGTPFHPFVTAFPESKRDIMIEAIATDYSANTMLYWAHRKGLISIRLEPETPRIGELLRTKCITSNLYDVDQETSSEESENSLVDMGFCLGDLIPDIRDQYPDRQFSIHIHSTRAPSILFSAKKGGSAIVDVEAEADLYLNGTTNKLGTMGAQIRVEVALQLKGKTIFGSGEIKKLHFSDKTGSLGLSDQALGNLSGTLNDLTSTLANDALKAGVPMIVSQSPAQPTTFYNFQIKIIEHGLYVAGDVTIVPALMGTLIYSGSCYPF